MVCIYCGGTTQVINSRLQRQKNNIWRRRSCTQCGGIFTTHEAPDLAAGLRVKARRSLVPFERDLLFASIYESSKHRKNPVSDAAALVDTILAQLVPAALNGVLERDTIATVTREVLGRFDAAAATMYAAFHPVAK